MRRDVPAVFFVTAVEDGLLGGVAVLEDEAEEAAEGGGAAALGVGFFPEVGDVFLAEFGEPIFNGGEDGLGLWVLGGADAAEGFVHGVSFFA